MGESCLCIGEERPTLDRELTVAPSQEVERLRIRLTGDSTTAELVPTTRGWADALLALWLADHPNPMVDPQVRVGAYVVSPASAGHPAPRLLVAAERCLVATKSALLPVMRPAEWRNLKRTLTESGLDQDVVEELVTPTTADGGFGSVEPRAVLSYVADIRDDVRAELLRYFADDLSSYAGSLRPLAGFNGPAHRLAAVEVLVPWSAVIALWEADGTERRRR